MINQLTNRQMALYCATEYVKAQVMAPATHQSSILTVAQKMLDFLEEGGDK